MSLQNILKDYETNAHKKAPEGIDSVAILRKGLIWEQLVYPELKESCKTIRRLAILPFTQSLGQEKINEYLELFKRLIQLGKLDERLSPEEFFKNPAYRLFNYSGTFDLESSLTSLAQPNPENIVIITDDHFWSGETIRQTLKDLERLGYKRDKMYFEPKEGIFYIGNPGKGKIWERALPYN